MSHTPTAPPRRAPATRRHRVRLAASVFAVIGGIIAGTGGALAAGEHRSPAAEPTGLPRATAPTVTFTEPTPGATSTQGRVVVRGRYASGTRVTAVTVVACRPSGPTTCKDYLLASSNGAFAKRWRGMPTRLAPDSVDGRTGWFSVVLTGLPSARLRVFAFGTDAVTPKGPSTQVDLVVKGAADPAYVSVLFGRANWVAAGGAGCTNRPKTARTLEQNAIDLAEHGLSGVAQVVTSRVDETEHLCPDNFALEASWRDLARLRDTYGWSLTSQTHTYPNLTTMSYEAVDAESSASLPIFTSHGHDRAWGSFAYPNNRQDERVQAIVMRYFGFGRVYSTLLNTRAESSVFPYPMRTLSVNGGRCRNPELSCYTMDVENDRMTTSPAAIARALKPGPGKWGVVQFYRIVEGVESSQDMSLAWDCSAANWQDRWTSQPELYCRSSLLEALALRNKSATAVDPAAMALAWGRRPWGR